jgi:hypothetical protein
MLESHTTFVPLHEKRAASEKEPVQTTEVTDLTIAVTDLTRHMRDEDLQSLVHRYIRIEKTTLSTARQLISPPSKVGTDLLNVFWEHVSDLNRVAVTTAFEQTTVEDVLKNECDRAVQFTKQAAQDEAEKSGYYFRWLQLRKQQRDRFSWLIGLLGQAVERIAGEVTRERKIAMKDLQHEQQLVSLITVPIPNWDEPERIRLEGRADIVFNPRDGSQATIWEIKWARWLKLEDVAQTVQYGLLWANAHPDTPFPRLLLFKVLDGERWEISTTEEEAREFVVGVFRAKRTRTKLTDDEFRQQCEKTSNEAQAIVDRIP